MEIVFSDVIVGEVIEIEKNNENCFGMMNFVADRKTSYPKKLR